LFLTQQFEAQHHHYQTYYVGHRSTIVLCAGEPIGGLYVAHWEREGERAGSRVSIHVERFNPALRLYRRLGFRVVEERGAPYYLMDWRPPAVT
jgi:hypothetical protein